MLSFTLLQSLEIVTMVTTEGCSETEPAMHLSNHAFGGAYFRNYLSSEGEVLSQNVQNFLWILNVE